MADGRETRATNPRTTGFANLPRGNPENYCAALQLPVLMQVDTSAHVACWPSIVHPQPNCEHHHCWLLAIAL